MRITIFIVLLSFSGYSIDYTKVRVGAERTEEYLELLKGKKVGVVANQTTLIGETHLVDSLISLNVEVIKIFSPEHGFRGTADAGEKVVDGKDSKTGLPVISLYGSHKKPTKEDFSDLDIVLFDIQDVGVRFYTYISTMHYIMEAAAEVGIDVLILDRPNPNGFFADGPILDLKQKSFIGMHEVPLVHGMTIAEYAKMINGELWLKDKLKCKLHIVKIENWDHNTFYKLPVKPSPNLPNMISVYSYPSLGLLEGTIVSIGRGTEFPFQVVGHPEWNKCNFSFTPISRPGAKKPKFKDKKCCGYDYRVNGEEGIISRKEIDLDIVIKAYTNMIDKEGFFRTSFNLLAGNSKLKSQIVNGVSKEEIRKSWEKDLISFKMKRKKYLLYKDFE